MPAISERTGFAGGFILAVAIPVASFLVLWGETRFTLKDTRDRMESHIAAEVSQRDTNAASHLGTELRLQRLEDNYQQIKGDLRDIKEAVQGTRNAKGRVP